MTDRTRSGAEERGNRNPAKDVLTFIPARITNEIKAAEVAAIVATRCQLNITNYTPLVSLTGPRLRKPINLR